MYELEDVKEKAAFYELDSHRSVAVVGAAIVENRLTALLRTSMLPDEPLLEEIFRPSGPVGPFGTKIRVAYLLNLIHRDLYRDLLIVNKIRNTFAHDVGVASFEEPTVRDRVRSLKAYAIWQEVAEDSRRKATEEPNDNVIRLHDSIVNDEMSTTRDAFRMCLRLYISKLVQAERRVRSPHEDPSVTREDENHEY